MNKSIERRQWTHREVLDLINIMKENHALQSTDFQTKKSGICYQIVFSMMQARGHNFTVMQIRRKWKSLKETYCKIRSSSNTSRESVVGIGWLYFDLLHQIFSERSPSQPMSKPGICVAKFCMSGPNSGEDISFFNLPEDESCCQNWLCGVGREDLCNFSSQELHKAGFRMCLKHFKSSDIHVKETTGELFVEKKAIPTQEENSSPHSKRQKINRTAPEMKFVLQEVPVELDENDNEDDENEYDENENEDDENENEDDENENEDDESIPVAFFKMDKSNERRQWAYQEVLDLINIMNENRFFQSMDLHKKKSGSYYNIVDSLMQARGHNFTVSQIQRKWKSLKTTYRKIRSSFSSSRESSGVMRWPFFDVLHQIFSERPHSQETTSELFVEKRAIPMQEENSSPLSKRQKINHTAPEMKFVLQEVPVELDENDNEYDENENEDDENENEDDDENENEHDESIPVAFFKMDKSNERRQWAYQEVLDLINIMNENRFFQSMDLHKKKSGSYYDIVDSLMQARGHNFTVLQIQRKWKSLKTTYRKIRRSFSSSRESSGVMRWPFFDVLHQIFSERPHSQPMSGSVTCVAKFCMSEPNSGDDISFFKLPEDESYCQSWLCGVGREDLCKFSSQDLHKAGYRMCLKHFKSSDIHVKKATGELFVEKRAIPTIEENSSPLSKKQKTDHTAKTKDVLQEVPVELDGNGNEDDENKNGDDENEDDANENGDDENENEDDESNSVACFKMDKSNERRQWAYREVLDLINIMKENHRLFQSMERKKNCSYYDIVGSLMQACGHNLTVLQIQRKWKSLKTTYKKLRSSFSSSGASAAAMGWPYFHPLHQIFSERPCSQLMSSSVICVAKFCMSDSNSGDDTSFFNLPEDERYCQNWLCGVEREDLCKFSSQDLHKAGFRMCLKHFKSSDIHVKETTGELFVEKRAIPTIDENSSPLSKRQKTDHTAPEMKFVLQEVPVELDENKDKDDENENEDDENEYDENEDDESIPVAVEDSPLKPVPLIFYCTVPLCSNNSKQHPHLAFHQIPTQNGASKKSQILHQKWRSWLEQLYSLWDIDYKFISNEVLVCSEHFSPGAFSSRPVQGACAENVKLSCHAYPTVDPLSHSFKNVRAEQIRLHQESCRKTNDNSEIDMDVIADKLDRSNKALEDINEFLTSSKCSSAVVFESNLSKIMLNLNEDSSTSNENNNQIFADKNLSVPSSSQRSSVVESKTNLCKEPNSSKIMPNLNEDSSTSNESNNQIFADENLSVLSSSQRSSAVESKTNLCKEQNSSKIMLNLNEDSSTSNESNNQIFADEIFSVTRFPSSINNLEAQSQTSTSSEDSCFMT